MHQAAALGPRDKAPRAEAVGASLIAVRRDALRGRRGLIEEIIRQRNVRKLALKLLSISLAEGAHQIQRMGLSDAALYGCRDPEIFNHASTQGAAGAVSFDASEESARERPSRSLLSLLCI